MTGSPRRPPLVARRPRGRAERRRRAQPSRTQVGCALPADRSAAWKPRQRQRDPVDVRFRGPGSGPANEGWQRAQRVLGRRAERGRRWRRRRSSRSGGGSPRRRRGRPSAVTSSSPRRCRWRRSTPTAAPNVRTVLMRFLDERGPGFVTDLGSAKSREIVATGSVAASLTWPAMFRAVRFRGRARPRRSRRDRRLLRHPAVGLADQRVGVGPVAADRRPGRAGRRLRAVRGPVPGHRLSRTTSPSPTGGAAGGSSATRSSCGRADATGCTTGWCSRASPTGAWTPPTRGRSTAASPEPARQGARRRPAVVVRSCSPVTVPTSHDCQVQELLTRSSCPVRRSSATSSSAASVRGRHA